MKKFLLISGLAVAAMVSCTKNEVFVSENNDAQISFKPLSATQTKSAPITSYVEATGDFNVYAWYQANGAFDPNSATVYMNNVTCKYDGNINDEADQGTGAWAPADKYYWPKNGTLTFSAYYPSNLSNVTVTAKNGIEIKDFEITDPTKQIDVMYSSRVFDKTKATLSDDNHDYDGVDIVFNHALSAVSFAVKAGADYGTDAIKLYKIEILKATSNGTFKEGYTTGVSTETPHAAWGNPTTVALNNSTDYTVFNETAGQALKTTVEKAGVDCIVLPQTFSNNIAIKVTYGIKYKNGTSEDYLEQTATFPLKNTTTNNGTAITAWEMGKWYKYTLTFTLDTIYFAPSVTPWEDVTVDGITVK